MRKENAASGAGSASTYTVFFTVIFLLSYVLGLVLAGITTLPDLAIAHQIGVAENFLSYDLLNFVTSVRIFLNGTSPYIYGMQNSYLHSVTGEPYPHLLNTLYPPFTLVVLTPFMLLPFSLIRVLWLLWSVLAIALAVDSLIPEESSSRIRFLAVAVGISFAPVLSMYYWGQITAFIVLCLARGFVDVQRKKYYRAGILLGLCCIKPQLWFLSALGVIVFSIKTRAWKLVFSGIAFLLVVSLSTEMILPGIHHDWYLSLRAISAHAANSVTPTVSGVLRYWIFTFLGNDPRYLSNVILLLSAFGYLGYCLSRRVEDITPYFVPGLLLAVFFAPYSWFHDQSVLLIPIMLLVAGQKQGRGTLILACFGFISIATSLIIHSSNVPQQYLLLYSSVCFCLYLWFSRPAASV